MAGAGHQATFAGTAQTSKQVRVSPNKKLSMSDVVDLDTHLYIPAGSILATNDVLAIAPRPYMKTYLGGIFDAIVDKIAL